MSIDTTEVEQRSFIMSGTRTGKFGVVRSDGTPIVMPVWFVLGEADSAVGIEEGGSSSSVC